jgi:hypothetical protein
MNDSPAPAAPAVSSLLDFTPVRLRYRRDGWTPPRQRAFIAALAESRCVLEACRRVGKSPEAAYKLYRRPDAAGLRAAWDRALAGRAPAAPPVRRAARAMPSSTGPSTSGRRWQPSVSSASSTSAPSTFAAEAPPRGARPAYSLEAFVRAARRARLAARPNGRPSE